MTDCECGQPPCKCKPFQRDNKCDHIETSFNTKGKKCNNKGTLRDDCNWFFYSKRVLCDNHYEQHRQDSARKCRICGTPKSGCCC